MEYCLRRLRAVQQVLLAEPGDALAQLMATARPRLVLALGEAAAQHLTGSSQSLDALRGKRDRNPPKKHGNLPL